MLFKLGLAFFFFLPIIESFNRSLGYDFLILGSLVLFLSLLFKKRFVFDWIDTLWLLLLVVFAISLHYTWSISRSYTEFLRYLAYFLIFVAIRNYGKPETIIVRFYFPMILVNSFILSLLSFTNFIPGFDPDNLSIIGRNLFYYDFGHNRLADILVFSLPIPVFLYLATNHHTSKKIYLMLAVFFIIALFTTMGRAAILSLSLALFIFYFTYHLNIFDLKQIKKLNIIISIITVLAIFLLISSFIYSNFLPHDKINAIKGFYKPADTDQRMDYLLQGLKSFIHSPLIGSGLDTFGYVSNLYRENSSFSWFMHNHYLQLLVETGVIGGLVFIFMILKLIQCSYRLLITSSSKYYFPIFISFLASSIQSLIDYNWQFISIFLIYWFGLALLHPAGKKDNPEISPKLIYIFLSIIICFYLIKIVIPLDTESIRMDAAEISLINPSDKKAEQLLLKAYRLDRYNINIILSLKNWYQKNKNEQQARYWSQQARDKDPIGSKEIH